MRLATTLLTAVLVFIGTAVRAEWPQELPDGTTVRQAVSSFDGSVYLAGTFTQALIFPTDSLTPDDGRVYVVKFNAAGEFVWATQMGPIGTEEISIGDLIVDETGDIVLTGLVGPEATFGFRGNATLSLTTDTPDSFYVERPARYVWLATLRDDGTSPAGGSSIPSWNSIAASGNFDNTDDCKNQAFGFGEIAGLVATADQYLVAGTYADQGDPDNSCTLASSRALVHSFSKSGGSAAAGGALRFIRRKHIFGKDQDDHGVEWLSRMRDITTDGGAVYLAASPPDDWVNSGPSRDGLIVSRWDPLIDPADDDAPLREWDVAFTNASSRGLNGRIVAADSHVNVSYEHSNGHGHIARISAGTQGIDFDESTLPGDDLFFSNDLLVVGRDLFQSWIDLDRSLRIRRFSLRDDQSGLDPNFWEGAAVTVGDGLSSPNVRLALQPGATFQSDRILVAGTFRGSLQLGIGGPTVGDEVPVLPPKRYGFAAPLDYETGNWDIERRYRVGQPIGRPLGVLTATEPTVLDRQAGTVSRAAAWDPSSNNGDGQLWAVGGNQTLETEWRTADGVYVSRERIDWSATDRFHPRGAPVEIGHSALSHEEVADFDGATQEGLTAAAPVVQNTADFTVAGWVRPEPITNAAVREVWSEFSANTGWRLYYNIGGGTATRFAIQFGSQEEFLLEPTPLGTWLWISLTFTANGDLVKLRVNDQSLAMPPGFGWPVANVPFQLGGTGFDGQMDSIGIWNRVLTNAELDDLEAAGLGTDPGELDSLRAGLTSGLQHWYQLNENTGQTRADSVGALNLVDLQMGDPVDGLEFVDGWQLSEIAPLAYADQATTFLNSGTGTFRADDLGRSTLWFNDPFRGLDRFVVIETVVPGGSEMPVIAQQGGCVVGQPLPPHPLHVDPFGQQVLDDNGYPVYLSGGPFPVAPGPVDAAGAASAYDPIARRGQMIAVNRALASQNQLMVVGYSDPDPDFGITWPDQPVSYGCDWPTVSSRIQVDTLIGSDYDVQPGISQAQFPSARVYVQNDPTDFGFNPNEEHAWLGPSYTDAPCTTLDPQPSWCQPKGEQAVFALRVPGALAPSEPFVLLKSRAEALDGVPGQPPLWEFSLYEVGREDIGNFFSYDLTVGERVPEPYPLSLPDFQGCADTLITDIIGRPSWQDVDGNVWAASAGTMEVRPYYEPPPGFYTEEGSLTENGCVRWLDDNALVEYRASWPTGSIRTLAVGDSLRDLDLQASVEIAYQEFPETAATAPDPNTSYLVRLIDWQTTRWAYVAISQTDLWPQRLIDEAPSDLRLRLEVDTLNGKLGWSGYRDGPDLVLLNVMSAAEADRLKALDSCETECETAIGLLFTATHSALANDNPPSSVIGAPALVSAGAAQGEGWFTLAYNNFEQATGDIGLEVFRLACDPEPGFLWSVDYDNVFDRRLAIRHSLDFAGRPDVNYTWYLRPDTGDPALLPPGEAWSARTTTGSTSDQTLLITVGDPANEDASFLGDNLLFASYTGAVYDGVCGGAPVLAGRRSDPTEPALAEGWIKRVVRGLNPFHQRSTDFHRNPASTYVSMIQQAGPLYERDIAFNGDLENLDSIGLIEAYETVLRRSLAISLDETDPPLGDVKKAVDNALLLGSSRVSDLFMLLGNEAVADALDPTIGFGTESGEYGTLAPAIHAFQNQVPTLLDEELGLYRGRDGSGSALNAPAYNRLRWNLTLGEGEIAYQQVYNLEDAGPDGEPDGDLDLDDAIRQYPMGHGDAWGHYLSAIKTYLRLLRDPNYVWLPRVEQVLVGQDPVLVDYFDERKLARTAAARARAGAAITDLTYRREFVADPDGQWQGYEDSEPERAWGVEQWARRAGQGALLDWAVVNSLLPTKAPDLMDQRPRLCPLDIDGATLDDDCREIPDPQSPPSPLTQIDRPAVPEIGEISTQFQAIQAKLDLADRGLNPLGLATGAVPFDIDPTFLEVGSAVQGETHFEQIWDRADKALGNAVTVFDHANRLTQSLRRNQDSLEDFRRNVVDGEWDYQNRLIETFGRPYPDAIGVEGPYPPGYEGPDLEMFAVMDPVEFGLPSRPERRRTVLRTAGPISAELGVFVDQALPPVLEDVVIEYEVEEGLGVVKPAAWEQPRPAEGEVQVALRDFTRNQISFAAALANYDAHLEEIQDTAELLRIQRGITADTIQIIDSRNSANRALNKQMDQANDLRLGFSRTANVIDDLREALGQAIADDEECKKDSTAMAAGCGFPIAKREGYLFSVLAGISTVSNAFGAAADQQEGVVLDLEQAKEEREHLAELQLVANIDDIEAERILRELEQLVRQEIGLRLELVERRLDLRENLATIRTTISEGLRLLRELVRFRQRVASDVEDYRYEDMTFRLLRNDALQKYRAQFDLAARYTYLAASAYDYETNLVGTDAASGREFLSEIVRERSLGEVSNGTPQTGSRGLADVLARLDANFDVLEGQLGFNNPQNEFNVFSLRREWLRTSTDRLTASAGNEERCRFEEPAPDSTWYVGLLGSRLYAAVTLEWNYQLDGELVRETLGTDLAGAQGSFQVLGPFPLPAGADDLGFRTLGGTGDADLYVRADEEPTESDFDCRSATPPGTLPNPRDVQGAQGWAEILKEAITSDLWQDDTFLRLARPFTDDPGCGVDLSSPACRLAPGLVLPIDSTVVEAGLNHFGWPLGPRDSGYDPSRFSTKIRSVGVWLVFRDDAADQYPETLRLYLIPAGADVLLPPTAGDFNRRHWTVVDQAIPVPFPIGGDDLIDPAWLPTVDNLSGGYGATRRFARFPAVKVDAQEGVDPRDLPEVGPATMKTDSRLIGRSVANTQWVLILSAETLGAGQGGAIVDGFDARDRLIELTDQLDDVLIGFQTYSYAGN